ncbi:uncharacterized protein [Littorina saxatilis]
MKSFCSVGMLVAAVLAALVAVKGQIPIPRRELGFVYANGQPNASVHLDFYIDLICPDSKAALPTVLQVADHYGPDRLQLVTHLFPLPYHRAGFYAAKGAHVVDMLSKGKSTYAWFNILYNNIDSLVNTATHQISDAAVVQQLAKLAEDVVSGSSGQFAKLVDSDTVEQDTRVAWKYACTRGVAATPTFMVNDVLVSADPSWTVKDWSKVIDPLLAPQQPVVIFQTCPADTKRCEYLPRKVECCTKGEYCIPNVGCRC